MGLNGEDCFQHLPYELVIAIHYFTPPIFSQLRTLRLTCKLFSQIVKSEEGLWKRALLHYWELAGYKDTYDILKAHEEAVKFGNAEINFGWFGKCVLNYKNYRCRKDEVENWLEIGPHLKTETEQGLQGFGIKLSSDFVRVGHFVNGRAHGEGTIWWKRQVNVRFLINMSSGDRYNGQHKEGLRDGLGTYVYPSGGIYEGEWFNNEKHGKGTYIWPDGKKYVGDWLKNQKDGKGILCWPDGSKYEGDWKNGNEHGEGTIMIMNHGGWKSTKGSFQNGKRHGPGFTSLFNGTTFQVEYKEDFPCGRGILRCANGFSFDGEWVDGVPTDEVSSIPNGVRDCVHMGQCSLTFTGETCDYPQIIFSCYECKADVCAVCWNACHAERHEAHRIKKWWTIGDYCRCGNACSKQWEKRQSPVDKMCS